MIPTLFSRLARFDHRGSGIYVGKYFLYAPYVDGIMLFYEDNMDNLLSGYDYLVVVETDLNAKYLLKKHYGIDMQQGIYKITRSGDQIMLTLT